MPATRSLFPALQRPEEVFMIVRLVLLSTVLVATTLLSLGPGATVPTENSLALTGADSGVSNPSVFPAAVPAATPIPPADFGTLSGLVKDSHDHKIDGATVKVFLDNGATVEDTTQGGGKYTFAHLIVGSHRVQAKHDGFNTDEKMVMIRKNRTKRKNFTLTPG